jgi:hypothetical protein
MKDFHHMETQQPRPDRYARTKCTCGRTVSCTFFIQLCTLRTAVCQEVEHHISLTPTLLPMHCGGS